MARTQEAGSATSYFNLLGWKGGGERLIRRNQQRKHDERRAIRAAGSEIHVGAYRPVARKNCIEQVRHSFIDDEATVRIEYRFWTYRGKVADFVLLLQEVELASGTWQNLARIDCCHGHVHLHKEDDQPADESIARLDTINDVGQAQKVAYERIRELAVRLLIKEET